MGVRINQAWACRLTKHGRTDLPSMGVQINQAWAYRLTKHGRSGTFAACMCTRLQHACAHACMYINTCRRLRVQTAARVTVTSSCQLCRVSTVRERTPWRGLVLPLAFKACTVRGRTPWRGLVLPLAFKACTVRERTPWRGFKSCVGPLSC